MGAESLEAVLVDEQTVNYEGAESVHASLRMGSGQVHVEGGAEQLMHAHFEYSHPDWKPEVEYHVTEGVGHLEVRQPNLLRTLSVNPQYTWELAFGDGAPTDLGVKLGSGNADLDLDGTSIAEPQRGCRKWPHRRQCDGGWPASEIDLAQGGQWPGDREP